MKWTAEEFYPTPESLLDKITKNVEWNAIQTVLEPSAGKGNIAEYVQNRCNRNRYYKEGVDIDCIEIDPDLRKTLNGKDFRVVHDDFLTFRTFKHYDLIIMNPPFSQGAKHLLHALDMQKDNFGLICILNAETLKNPHTNERKDLLKRLNDMNAEIEYMQGEFASAEHETEVEIAVIKVLVAAAEQDSFIYEDLQKKTYRETTDYEATDVAPNDFIEAAVRQYNIEVEAGIKLILEYKAMCPHILSSIEDSAYNTPILEMKIKGKDLSTNAFVREVRTKYWNALFRNNKFMGRLTSKLRDKLGERVDQLKDYDFSMYNINSIQMEMSKGLVEGVEESIVSLFDELSHQYAYSDELKNNIHYYNGWKTNKSWFINKKVILPYMNAFSEWSGEFSPDYRVVGKLMDIEKALNYLDCGLTDALDMAQCIDYAKEQGLTKKIRTKYFYVTFYKKGTCHIEFTNEDLLKKLNIFGSQQKGWLPQGYGKRAYKDMNTEEKAVIDSFEGETQYGRTVAKANYFIYDPAESIKMIGTSKTDAEAA